MAGSGWWPGPPGSGRPRCRWAVSWTRALSHWERARRPGGVHGHRPDPHQAPVLCLQRQLSLAITPVARQWFARVNPLTCQVDILRALMLSGGRRALGLSLDFAVLTASLVILVAIAARLYPRAVL